MKLIKEKFYYDVMKFEKNKMKSGNNIKTHHLPFSQLSGLRFTFFSFVTMKIICPSPS